MSKGNNIDTALALCTVMDKKPVTVRVLAGQYGCSTAHIYRLRKKGAVEMGVIAKLCSTLDIPQIEFMQAGVQ